jgi:hypothetical protein
VRADEDAVTAMARELYAGDIHSALRAAGVPDDDLSPWKCGTYVRVARWEARRQRR